MDYIKNPWNYVHFLGSTVLAVGIYQKFFGNYWAFIIAFACGLVWEGFDEANKRFNWNMWFLDPKGLCKIDLITDLLGVLLAVFLMIC